MKAKIKYYESASLKYALVAMDGKLLFLAATEKEIRDYARNKGIEIQ